MDGVVLTCCKKCNHVAQYCGVGGILVSVSVAGTEGLLSIRALTLLNLNETITSRTQRKRKLVSCLEQATQYIGETHCWTELAWG